MLARDPTDILSNLFVADEAQLLVPKILQKVIITQSWPATEFATRLRKRECGLLLITQSPTNLESGIFKNSATKIAFRLQNQEDIKLIADSVGFVDMAEYEYLSNVLVNLARKQAVVCAPDHEPFLITTRNFEPGLSVSPVSLSAPFPESSLVSKSESSEAREEALLKSVEEHPFLSVSERRSILGWNHKTYSGVVSSLLKRGLIEEQEVVIGRGSPKVLYQRKGAVPSVKHQFILQWIIDSLKEKGYSRFKANVAAGPDLEVLEAGTAIEIELGKSNVYSNAVHDVQKFGRVIVTSDDKQVLQALSAKIKDKRILVLPIRQVPACFEKKQA